MPRTASVKKQRKSPGRSDNKSRSKSRKSAQRAHSDMSLTQLQVIANSLGIPFGALDKSRLIREINRHY